MTQDAAFLVSKARDPGEAIKRLAGESKQREGDFEHRQRLFEAQYVSWKRGDWMNPRPPAPVAWRGATPPLRPINNGSVARLPFAQRLALEMALHEHSEQFAIENELATLERDWREAEEIAAIADDLLTPAPIREALAAAKRTRK